MDEGLEILLSKMSVDEDFDDAVQYMNAAKHLRVKDEQKLHLYGSFKQATAGDNASTRPGLLEFVARAKWDAWTECRGLSPDEAKVRYISVVESISPQWRDEAPSDMTMQHQVQEKSEADGWVSVSTMVAAEGDPEAAPWAQSEQLHQAASNGDLTGVLTILEQGRCDVNALDSEGSTALHYAADRGFVEIVQALLAHGAAVNIVDSDEQTPLLLAAICEQREVARLLLDAGARLPEGDDVDADVAAFVASV